jgi:hypothetical protein
LDARSLTQLCMKELVSPPWKAVPIGPRYDYGFDRYFPLVLIPRFAVGSSSPVDDVMSSHQLGLPLRTVLIFKPPHLNAVIDAIITNAKKSFSSLSLGGISSQGFLKATSPEKVSGTGRCSTMPVVPSLGRTRPP